MTAMTPSEMREHARVYAGTMGGPLWLALAEVTDNHFALQRQYQEKVGRLEQTVAALRERVEELEAMMEEKHPSLRLRREIASAD